VAALRAYGRRLSADIGMEAVCLFRGMFCTWISLQPLLRSSGWPYHKKGNTIQNSTAYSAYGNTANFSHTNAFLSVITPIETNACADAEIAW